MTVRHFSPRFLYTTRKFTLYLNMIWTAWIWYSSYLSPSLYPRVAVGCSLHYKGRRKCSYPPMSCHLFLLIHRMMEKKILLHFVNSIFLRLCVHLAVCHSAFLSRFLHPVFVTDECFYFTQGSNKILPDISPRTRLALKKKNCLNRYLTIYFLSAFTSIPTSKY